MAPRHWPQRLAPNITSAEQDSCTLSQNLSTQSPLNWLKAGNRKILQRILPNTSAIVAIDSFSVSAFLPRKEPIVRWR